MKRRRLFLLLSIGCLPLGILLIACVASYRNTITPDGIIIHHSAVTLTREGSPVDMKVLDNAHRRRGFGAFYWGRTYHVGYHYVIFPDGRVERGRPERCVGAHAAGRNSELGICLIGDFSSAGDPAGRQRPSEPTEAQIGALVNLCQELRARYHIPVERVRRHRDVSGSTECPGDRFPFEAFTSRLGRK